MKLRLAGNFNVSLNFSDLWTMLIIRQVDVVAFKNAVLRACEAVIAAEPRITHSDTIVGDGDCGTTLSRGATAVLGFLESSDLTEDAVLTILRLATIIEDNMDGTSGAIYSFFSALASALRSLSQVQEVINTRIWVAAAKAALEQLQLATPARQGDRTLMDALEPFIKALADGETFDVAISRARSGVEATKGMRAAFGRAVYVEEGLWKTVPDPGAEGVLCLLAGLGGVVLV
jgi:dihydroxyacetone kinase